MREFRLAGYRGYSCDVRSVPRSADGVDWGAQRSGYRFFRRGCSECDGHGGEHWDWARANSGDGIGRRLQYPFVGAGCLHAEI